MEELQARHREEQRELQNRITQKKKNATKKTRKGVNGECEVLERDLRERQKNEIEGLNGSGLGDGVENLTLNGDGQQHPNADARHELPKQVEVEALAREAEDEVATDTQRRSKKPNRQKARLARRAADQEAQAAAAAEEAANLPDLRSQELKAMKTHMEKLGLIEFSIRPDGHCLYSACAHGMTAGQVKASGPYVVPYQNVRYAAGDFISHHPDDFAPFLEEPLEAYVKKVKDTAEWGGQLELQAIARAYNVGINVLQADGRVEKITSHSVDKPKGAEVWLAYYRHSFGLGEHYNALTKNDQP